MISKADFQGCTSQKEKPRTPLSTQCEFACLIPFAKSPGIIRVPVGAGLKPARFPSLLPGHRTLRHSLVTAFCEQAKDMLKQIGFLKQQNRKLRDGRDLLLPRLMSGEIAV